MNFTREPIIETVITPREGCKLVVRNSKGAGQEDYFVDAIEVVTFGHSFFFRSQERPKSFLVPVSDYEILEIKETRTVFKNVGHDRSIKIGGGREMPVRAAQQPKEPSEEPIYEEAEGSSAESSEQQPMQSADRGIDKKRDRRRPRRRRGGSDMREGPEGQRPEAPRHEASSEAGPTEAVDKPHEEAPPSFISKLFPPPPTLIKETLSRLKMNEEKSEVEEKPSLHEDIFEHPAPSSDEEEPDSREDD